MSYMAMKTHYYKQSGNKIILNLGFSNGKRKLATYQNGEISIDWQTVI